MRILAFAVLLVAAAGCNCAPDPTATSDAGTDPTRASSGFDTGDDGWTIVGDAQSMAVRPDFDGGFISAKDDVAGGTWYFQAPAKYLGDNSAIAGNFLQFDLRVTPVDNPFGNYDVVLQGGGKTLAFDFPNDPTTAWTTYRAQLVPAGWKVVADPVISNISSADFSKLPDATEGEFAAALQQTTLLRLRGEFNSGPDTGALDNVRWGTR